MVRDHSPFGLALARLRDDLRDGQIRPGEPLITTDLAASLKISATPVREALARLTGEGLLEDRRGRGVYALRFGAMEIEDLTRLHGCYVDFALSIRQDRRSSVTFIDQGDTSPIAPYATRSRSELFWSTLIQSADSEALTRAHQRLSDQLAVVRLIEPRVFKDVNAELSALIDLQNGPAPLQVAVAKYHRRREIASRDMAAALRELIGDVAKREQL